MTRRMFSDEITASDSFLDMPSGSQLLYFQLGMIADDDGFIGSPKMVMRIIGSSDDEYKILVAKKFILHFDTGICVVKHWRMNNQLRKDRYHETKYTDEKKSLFIRKNGSYTTNPNEALPLPNGHFSTEELFDKSSGNHLATIGKPSIVKVSIGKDSIEDIHNQKKKPKTKKEQIQKNTHGEFSNVKLTSEEHEKLLEFMGEKNTMILITELDGYIESKGDKYKSHYATIKNWARRKAMEMKQTKKSNTNAF